MRPVDVRPLRGHLALLRPPRIAMSLVAAAAALHLLFPITVVPPSSIGGLLVGTAGLSLMIRAWWLFRRSGTAICPTDRASVLLTRDVCRFMRNPMYLGTVMIMLGVAISFGTAPFFAAAALLFAILNFAFCRFEEERLRTAFPGYAAYAARVRRWI
jgi:protein-S-isoprenylcysteine O-methyltransferase Ste14